MTASAIEWTDEVWNPVTGCDKVSAGCKNCYAERMFNRLSHNPKTPEYNGRMFGDVMCHEDRLQDPLNWKKPRRVFVNSMSDLFHPAVPFAFIDKVFGIMAMSPYHMFQVLTKRPERALEYFASIGTVTPEIDKMIPMRVLRAADAAGVDVRIVYANMDMLWPLTNVWLGVSVENQEQADKRIPLLIDCPAAVRWLSCEPLLGPIDLEPVFNSRRHTEVTNVEGYASKCTEPHLTCAGVINWVVVGGESGPKARPMHPDWARSLRDQCQAADVPFFFKQWGEWISVEHEEFCRLPSGKIMHIDRSGGILDPAPQDEDADCTTMKHVSKHRAGRMLLGREWNEMPVR